MAWDLIGHFCQITFAGWLDHVGGLAVASFGLVGRADR
jgi:hypothetical protein